MKHTLLVVLGLLASAPAFARHHHELEREFDRRETVDAIRDDQARCAAGAQEKWNSILKYIELVLHSRAIRFEVMDKTPVETCHSGARVMTQLEDGRLCRIGVAQPGTAYFKEPHEVGYDGTPLAGMLLVHGTCH